jgi:hypothetical protein
LLDKKALPSASAITKDLAIQFSRNKSLHSNHNFVLAAGVILGASRKFVSLSSFQGTINQSFIARLPADKYLSIAPQATTNGCSSRPLPSFESLRLSKLNTSEML